MNDLNPCPFCGSEDLRESKEFKIINDEYKILIVTIQCFRCGANGPTILHAKDIRQAWNERK